MTWMDTATETYQKQGSDAWRSWRTKHIGASEVSAILGESDFSNPYKVWLEKTGQAPAFAGNFATQRGTDAEPEIRRLYEETYNTKTTAPVLEYPNWPILSASLDGYDEEMGIVAEFKYPSKEKHAMAERGEVPQTYRAQIQAQLLVAGCDTAHYVSYNGRSIAVVVVKADSKEQERVLTACKEFWKLVETRTPPAGAPVVIENHTLEILAKEYRRLHLLSVNTKMQMDTLRARFDELVVEDKAKFYGLSFSRSERVGAVDYAAIPQLQGLDLSQYRKPGVKTLTIKLEAENE